VEKGEKSRRSKAIEERERGRERESEKIGANTE
jgi:hypothetical protein